MEITSYLLGKKSGGGGSALQTKSVSVTNNGTSTINPDEGYNGMSSVDLSVNVSPNLQDKSVTITENTTTTIEKDSGYDGLGEVSITTNVPSSGLDFTEIGYASTPTFVNNAMNYAKQIYQNWDASSSCENKYKQDKNIIYFPNVDISQTTIAKNMFNNSNVQVVPDVLNFTNVNQSSQYLFANCNSLIEIGTINMPNVQYCDYMFQYCKSLRKVGALNLTKAKQFASMFQECFSLIEIGLIDCSGVDNVGSIFGNYYDNLSNLTTLAGFKNLGKSYKTSWSENTGNGTLDLRPLRNLSHQSALNVLNSIYDLTSINVKPQKLIFYSSVLNNLTEEEKAIGTNKGWNVVSS